mgnify:FL=1
MSNIWHDINPRRISPEKFMAVIEIPKGVKNKYEMDKETGLLRLTAYFTHQLTILQTTDLFRERMRRIMTRLTFLYFVRNQ